MPRRHQRFHGHYPGGYYFPSYYEPLPVRPLVTGDVRKPDSFVDCVTSSVQRCARDFEGPGLRSCIFGFLTTSNLLPVGVASQSTVSRDGGYRAGLQMYCPAHE